MKTSVFFLSIIISSLVFSCATYRNDYFRLPITVLTGSADITFTFVPLTVDKEHSDDEMFKLTMQRSKKNSDDYRRAEKQAPLPRKSPSENDYQSNIRYRSRRYSPAAADARLDTGHTLYHPYKECVQAGGSFFMRIPRGYRMEMSVTNADSEILEFTSGGHVFRLEQGESKALEFR